MEIFRTMTSLDYEQVMFCQDASSGLKAVIAIHDTTLGPALGGCRMWTYASEAEAVVDALRLARGMTYKTAMAGLNFGGGKAVIVGDPRTEKTEALFRAFGRYVQSLGGRYITAEDVGTTTREMDWIRLETPYVTGVSVAAGGGGDPSPMTALGVFRSIQAALAEVYGSDDPAGRTVAVQGLGSVGYHLCKLLHQAGAELVVTDLREEAVQRAVREFGAEAVDLEGIYDVPADVFAPCALGGVINDGTIPRLKCRIVAGSANNQLAEDRHGAELEARGILYVPDYVANAGGVIHVADELEGYRPERVRARVEGIYDRVRDVFALARKKRIPAHQAADRLAEERIAVLRQVRSTFVVHS
ncbi:Glu/Leu/Phe/Val dehydrogenase [Kyrpidia sp.]|uniref:Glu/Leu/Phe/Val family dehydrogenase n=1 Tax=Kyrpidia sp. TaxID=2073077 RepID=UPI00258ED3D7|nr:Glu/Leu/Phe/Val dehydrogenase [Kyrpidia sp.]MCL6575726.1 leucine dehydrogenase [Kyrpidia sp.]